MIRNQQLNLVPNGLANGTTQRFQGYRVPKQSNQRHGPAFQKVRPTNDPKVPSYGKIPEKKKGQPKRELKHFSCTACPHRNCSFADTRKCVHILQSNSITLLARLGELTMPCILLRQVVFYMFYTSFEMAHTRTGVQATNKL